MSQPPKVRKIAVLGARAVGKVCIGQCCFSYRHVHKPLKDDDDRFVFLKRSNKLCIKIGFDLTSKCHNWDGKGKGSKYKSCWMGLISIVCL
jgi:hypothetical protein